MGYKRNLSVGEVVDQYLLTAKEHGKKILPISFIWGWVNLLLTTKQH